MNFAYRDLGNELPNALANWVDLCRKWPQPVGLFFDARYRAGELPVELQFRRVAEAGGADKGLVHAPQFGRGG